MGRSERHIDTGIQSDYVLMSSNIYHCYCNTTDIALSWCHFGSWFQSVCTCTWFKTGASFKTHGIFFGSSKHSQQTLDIWYNQIFKIFSSLFVVGLFLFVGSVLNVTGDFNFGEFLKIATIVQNYIPIPQKTSCIFVIYFGVPTFNYLLILVFIDFKLVCVI